MKTSIFLLLIMLSINIYAQECVEINGCDADLVSEVKEKFRWPGDFIKMVNEGGVLPQCRFACKESTSNKERQLFIDYMRIREEYHAESKHYSINFDPNDQIEIEKLNAEIAEETE